MNIKKRIRENGWTVGRLAKELGVKQPSLSTMINGNNPTYESLRKIANVIGISVSELVREDGDCSTIICPHCGGAIMIEPKKK